MRALIPASIAPPFARYAHGTEVPADARWIVTSGQLGLSASGDVPDGAEAQAALCFSNITAILADGGMTPEDTVRINAYVSDRHHMAGYMTARDLWLRSATRLPASTLMVVSGFTRPEFVVEIEVIAARA